MLKISTILAALSSVAVISSGKAALAQVYPAPAREPPAPTSMTPTSVALWRSAYVDERNIVPIGASDKGVEYGVGGSFSITSGGTVRGWMRWEQFNPTTVGDATTRSFTQLVEVDCNGGRGRLLALDLYPYNNLQGEARHIDAENAQWTYARPDTVLEQNIKVMCGAASSLVRQAVVAQAPASSDGLRTTGSMLISTTH